MFTSPSDPTQLASAAADHARVILASTGNRPAFEELYLRSIRRVYGLVFRVVGTAYEAEEVTQEAYLQIHRALPRFEGRSSFTTWAFRIAMNVSLQYVKARSRRARHLSAAMTPGSGMSSSNWEHDPEREVERRALYVGLRSSIDRLNTAQRTVTVLGPIQGHTYAQMSRSLGTSTNVIKGRLHRARQSLKVLLAELGALPDRDLQLAS